MNFRRFTSASRVLVVLLAMTLVWAGCSRKKTGLTNRMFHQTTARFNGYFNAKEMMMALEENLRVQNQENWDELLPVFIYPDEEKAQQLYPELDVIIEKCSKVIQRHSMRIRNKEHNKWIDDNYFLIGKANFYKRTYGSAQEMFTYVSKAFKQQNTRYDAGIWLARVYMETNRMSKANSVLKKVSEEKDLPKHIEAELPAVYADYYIRQENWDSAIEMLEQAIEHARDKQFRIRLTFILAQVYDKKGDSRKAVQTFSRVVRMAPPYEMEFNARLYQAYAHSGRMDATEVRRMLQRMLRDVKNYEYRDQVYFAMADVELKERDIETAIEYLIKSGEVSTTPKHKAKAYYTLADLYFDQRKYVLARNYYDSTLAVINEEMPNYQEIKTKAENLNELVEHILNVELQDSLIMMVDLPEKDREKKILAEIARLEAEEEKMRKAMESGQLGGFTAQDQRQAGMSMGGGGGGKGDWYFWNNTTRSHGFNEFRRVWGNRELEDDWRRKNKGQKAGGGWDDDDPDGGGEPEFVSSVPTLEEFLAGLPMNDTAYAAAHYSVIESTYQMGVIYKEKLHDEDNAIEAFTRLILDYDTSEYALTATYQLYRLYLAKEQSGTFFGSGRLDNSDYYKYIILDDHPDSKYAKLILNPNWRQEEADRLAEAKKLYEATYTQFRRRQYTDALYTCNNVITEDPENFLLPKFYLLKALVIAQKKDRATYVETLRELIGRYPGTEEAEKAKELLGALGESTHDPDKAPPEEEKPKEEIKEEKKESPYVFDEKASHFFAMVFPNKGVNANDLKAAIADFNSSFFRNKDIKVTNSFINADNQIMILRSFSNFSEAMDYYNTFVKNNTVLKDINAKDYDRFVISTKNFTTLFKQKDVPQYIEFYEENYLKSK